MKKLLIAILLCSLSCNESKPVNPPPTATDSNSYNDAEQLVMEKAKPAYVKAFAEINEIRNSIKLAEAGNLEKESVVKLYNNTVGKTMGELKSFSEMKTRIDTAGDAYIKYRWNLEAARIAREMAAEKKFEIENQKK